MTTELKMQVCPECPPIPPSSGRGLDPRERPNVYQQDHSNFDPEHGAEGHIGVRCSICAGLSPNAVLIESSSGDYWQTKQLNWQEDCDEVHTAFQEATAAHFPEHKPFGCDTCPTKPIMPIKPQRPIDRVDKQMQREIKRNGDYA